MKIELLYFQGCPSWKPAAEHLKAVLTELGIRERIRFIEIKDDTDVAKHGFIGSPTIRINGRDIEPRARNIRKYFLGCRVYNVEGVLQGWPSPEMIREALVQAEGPSGHGVS